MFSTNHFSATNKNCFKLIGRDQALIYSDDIAVWGALLEEDEDW
jgi:hypothetical protein